MTVTSLTTSRPAEGAPATAAAVVCDVQPRPSAGSGTPVAPGSKSCDLRCSLSCDNLALSIDGLPLDDGACVRASTADRCRPPSPVPGCLEVPDVACGVVPDRLEPRQSSGLDSQLGFLHHSSDVVSPTADFITGASSGGVASSAVRSDQAVGRFVEAHDSDASLSVHQALDHVDGAPLAWTTLPDYSAAPGACQDSRAGICWSDVDGAIDGATVWDSITAAYCEVVHWRRNLFTVPNGHAGKDFVRELTRLFRAFGEQSLLEGLALKAALLLPVLVLQRPHSASRAKDHAQCLERRLRAWRVGRIDDLVREGRTIQAHLPPNSPNGTSGAVFERTFARLVFAGKLGAAMRLLSEHASGGEGGAGVLDLAAPESPDSTTTVRDVLLSKHPPAAGLNEAALCNTDPTFQPVDVHPVLFDRLNGSIIRQAALRTRGSAGPSGVNADNWRRLCTAFRSVSSDLCEALALVARRVCTMYVDPSSLSAFVACRLIPLDKNPGVRPIGVCECVRRIIGKAVLSVLGPDVQSAAGSLQLCAGQPGGIEAAIHAMQALYERPDTDAILLVDAQNAFNLLNRRAALLNIRWICPSLATVLINFYRAPASLFVGGDTLLSCEGTTQGDPLAMAMYGLAVLPLIRRLSDLAQQVWYADDATGGGSLHRVRGWWDKLNVVGPTFGYFPNAIKTWLVVKEPVLAAAQSLFQDTAINITSDGRRLLGAPLGTEGFCRDFLEKRVASWVQEVSVLAEVAVTQPHAAYAAFTHALIGQWDFLARCVDGFCAFLSPLEQVIRQKFLPSLTGRGAPGEEVRSLFGLPTRLGGLGIIDPVSALAEEHARSKYIVEPITSLLLEQQPSLGDACATVISRKRNAAIQKRKAVADSAAALKTSLIPTLQRAMVVAEDRGASHWLSALPLSTHGFTLTKASFRDALCLRYGWRPDHLPARCVCGDEFTLDHALCCPTGGYPSIRHNEIRDMTASLLSEVCSDVQTEPPLQPLSGEVMHGRTANIQPEARLDISARGFWGDRFSSTFFDVRVFHPNARSTHHVSLPSLYARHERAKRRQYEQRVCDVEHATFTPLIFSSAGGMGHAASVAYKRLAGLLAEKAGLPYACVMSWLRCRLSFALLRSSIMCLRGSRRRQPPIEFLPTLAVAEGRLSSSV